MLVKLPVTLIPVLGGALAGVTVTVSRLLLEGSTESGVAKPSPKICVTSPPQPCGGKVLLRGIGPSTRKSLKLLLVSVQPLFLRMAAVVLVSGAVGEVSEQVAAVPEPLL